MGMNDYQRKLLNEHWLPDGDHNTVLTILAPLFKAMDAAPVGEDNEPTAMQIGFLNGLMDLKDEDRLWVLSLLLGGEVRSSKDTPLLTKAKASVLITFYKDYPDQGRLLHEKLGYRSRKAANQAKRSEEGYPTPPPARATFQGS